MRDRERETRHGDKCCAQLNGADLKIEYRNVYKSEHVSRGMWACCIYVVASILFFFFFASSHFIRQIPSSQPNTKNMFSSHEASFAVYL